MADKKIEEKKEEAPIEKEPVNEEKKAEPKKEEKKEEKKPEEKKEETKKEEKKESKKSDKKKEEKEEIIEEKIVSVSLREAWKAPRTTRTKAAVRVLKEQLKRHVKKDVLISKELNMKVWEHGIQRPPRVVKAKVQITKDKAIAYPME